MLLDQQIVYNVTAQNVSCLAAAHARNHTASLTWSIDLFHRSIAISFPVFLRELRQQFHRSMAFG